MRRVGVDLVEVDRISDLKPELRQRFVHRVCTPYEASEWARTDALLAACFAVKEAVAKALGCGLVDIGWQDVELQRSTDQVMTLNLGGRAHDLAEQLGLKIWWVSTGQTAKYALAVVVAEGQSDGEIKNLT